MSEDQPRPEGEQVDALQSEQDGHSFHIPLVEVDDSSVSPHDTTPSDGQADEWMPPEGTKNNEKAHEEALAEEEGRQRFTDKWYGWHENDWDFDPSKGPEKSVLREVARPYTETAEEGYEVRRLAERLGKSEQEVRDQMGKEMDAMLDYGLAMIGSRREFGEKTTLEERAFETLAEFVKAHPEIKNGPVSLDEKKRNAAFVHLIPGKVTGLYEYGVEATMHAWLKFGIQDGTVSNGLNADWTAGPYKGSGTYQEVAYSTEQVHGANTSVKTERYRQMTEQDLEQLQQRLAQVGDKLAEKQQAA